MALQSIKHYVVYTATPVTPKALEFTTTIFPFFYSYRYSGVPPGVEKVSNGTKKNET